jgi:AbrB family looped-hinge helix DNA binding protein
MRNIAGTGHWQKNWRVLDLFTYLCKVIPRGITMRVTSKGQVTIPKAVRDKLGITPGTDVGFSEDGALVLNETPEQFEGESRGARMARLLVEFGEKARREGWLNDLTTDEIMEMTRGPRDERNAR